MHQRHTTGLAVPARDTRYYTIRGREERHPITANQHIRCCLANLMTYTDPVNRVTGVQCPLDDQSLRLRLVAILGLAGKQERRVLQTKRPNLYLMTFVHKLTSQTFVERRQSASIRPRCT